jgi:TRAP-type C4-dicarboxylate transport system permease small subunit
MRNLKIFIVKFLEQMSGIFLMALTSLAIIEVIGRYAFKYSMTWSYEIILLLAIWMVWLGLPVGFDRWEHLSVTFFVNEKRKFFIWLHVILSLFFMVVVCLFTFSVMDGFAGMRFTTINIPLNAKYLAPAVGGSLSAFVLLDRLFNLFKEK